MKLRSVKKINLKNKIVLLRVNFDVPIKNGRVVDGSRILAHLPTINFLLKNGAKQIILISHLGQPNKIKNEKLKFKNYSLKPVAKYLQSRLKIKGLRLKFLETLDRAKIKKEIEKIKFGEIALLENLRFYPGERTNNKNFAKFLASLADIYPVRSSSRNLRYKESGGEVALAASADSKKEDLGKTSNGVYINDAFAVCHRTHASVSAITKYLPSYAGLLLEKEIENLSEVKKPKHPFIVLMGGAKISSKLPVLINLAKKADKILVGGALANDILKINGYNIGESLSEKKVNKAIKDLRLKIKRKIILPVDVVIKTDNRQQIAYNTNQKIIKNLKIEELNNFKNKYFKILDIGQETIKLFAKYLQNARMIVWNGPMGLFEEKPFDQGTKFLAKKILKNKKAKIIIGGGDTITCLWQVRGLTRMGTRINADISDNQCLDQRQSARVFVSTGGGAMLEFLTGKNLPGIQPLLK